MVFNPVNWYIIGRQLRWQQRCRHARQNGTGVTAHALSNNRSVCSKRCEIYLMREPQSAGIYKYSYRQRCFKMDQCSANAC